MKTQKSHTNFQSEVETIYRGQGFRINEEHLSKVLLQRYISGVKERYQFKFDYSDETIKKTNHIPGECPCRECDNEMSRIVSIYGRI